MLCPKVAQLDVKKHSTDPAAESHGIWSAVRNLAARVGSCCWTDGRFWSLRTARPILHSTCRHRCGDSCHLLSVYQFLVVLDQLSHPQDYYSSYRIAIIGRQRFCLSLLVLRRGFSGRIVSNDITLLALRYHPQLAQSGDCTSLRRLSAETGVNE